MKVLAIYIQNLASLEEVHIDFCAEPLYSAGIFAITGATGAGKSTILDALCLALYAQTPRYKQARELGIHLVDVQGSTISQSDARAILRDGTAEGSAEVHFEAVNGMIYSATWSVRRSRNKADGKMQDYQLALRNLTNNTDIPGKKIELLTEIEQLVGLNFEQFTRSVLLAQGDFTAFMKADKDEKSSLLEKLTGTTIYTEISKQVFMHYAHEKSVLQTLSQSKDYISVLDDESITQYLESKAQLYNTLALLKQQETTLRKDIDWHENLAKITDRHAQAVDLYTKAREAQYNTIAKKDLLQLVEKAQSIKHNYLSKETATKSLLAAQNDLKQKRQNITTFSAELETLHKDFQHANEHVVAIDSFITEQTPLLETAIGIDENIKQLDKQYNAEKTALNNAIKEDEANQNTLTELRNTHSQLQVEKKSICEWFESNSNRASIAENIPLIKVKLSDAGDIIATLQKQQKALDFQEAEVEKQVLAFASIQQDITILQGNIQNTSGELQQLSLLRSAINIGQVEQNYAVLAQKIEKWNLTKGLWLKLNEAQQALLRVQNELSNIIKQIELAKAQYSATENFLSTIEIKYQTSKKLLEQVRLEVASNVVALRETLEEGSPCPVCGSAEHPYAKHLEVKTLSIIEQNHLVNEQERETCIKQLAMLNGQIETLIANKSVAQKALTTSNEQVEKLLASWQENDFVRGQSLQQVDLSENLFDEEIHLLKNKIETYAQQIKTHYTHSNNIALLKEKLTEQKDLWSKKENEYKDIERIISTAKQQIASLNTDMIQNQQQLDGTRSVLNNYITKDEWFEAWSQQPGVFLENITGFATLWNEKNIVLEQLKMKLQKLETQLAQLETQKKFSAQSLFAQQEAFDFLEKNIADTVLERRKLFGGRSVEEVRKEWENSRAKSYADLRNIEMMVNEKQLSLEKALIAEAQIIDTIEQYKKTITNEETTIQKWLQQNNNPLVDTDVQLSQLVAYDEDWIEKERSAIQKVERNVLTAASILQERKAALDNHRLQQPQNIDLATIKEALNLIINQIEEVQKEHTEIELILREDDASRKKATLLLQQIDAQQQLTEDWQRLNEVIGSADGKKFRQIAQEYTLDLLLRYADVHLKTLCNRYTIQRVQNTLALQVIDHDMGDEVRSVFSLSGGESFLVSLALALGLASLSSGNVKVSSLFIDEGFGTLDPNTFTIAIDALERLHSQGRKVGIISHVQEMSERIPVQIQVLLQGNGGSTVQIVG